MLKVADIPAVYVQDNGTGDKRMSKYYFLITVYLIAVLSSSIANWLSIDVQNLLRIPFINLRLIDLAVFYIVIDFLYNLITNTQKLANKKFLTILCSLYLLFESVQLARSFGLIDTSSQISLFVATLCMFIVIDLLTFPLKLSVIMDFIEKFAIASAVITMLSNFYLLYAFFTGRVVFTDLDVRVAIEVIGSKESIYSFILTSFVYAFGLLYIQGKGPVLIKLLFGLAILSIFGAMVIQIFRGVLLMIVMITFYFIFFSATIKQTIYKAAGFLFFMVAGYALFGSTLASKGYDPVDKIVEVFEFSVDVDDPNWDKGRAEAQNYSRRAWLENFWIGAGYDNVGNYGAPDDVLNPHNGIIQSLFHRGVIGTSILLLIIGLLFYYAMRLWFMLRSNSTYESEVVKVLVLVSFLWVITFMTEEALWEKYSLSIEFLFLGLIANLYKQQVAYK
jgi:O-antigen ligase